VALILMLGVGLVIQAAMLAVMLRPRRDEAVVEHADPLVLIERARKLGVRKLEISGLKVEIEPLVVLPEQPKPMTPEEQKQYEEDLLLHSVNS